MTALSPLLRQATPVVAERGEGPYLFGADGRRYLDFTAGIGVTSTGHCHPKVVAAAQEQVGRLIHGQYTTVMHEPLQRLVAVPPLGPAPRHLVLGQRLSGQPRVVRVLRTDLHVGVADDPPIVADGGLRNPQVPVR